MNEGELVKHAATGAATVVVFAIVLKIMWEVMRERDNKIGAALKEHCTDDVETFKTIEQKLAEKQDKDMCLMEHKGVAAAFEDGREKFRKIVEQQTKTTDDVQQLVTRFALITQRLEIVLPKLEAALEARAAK